MIELPTLFLLAVLGLSNMVLGIALLIASNLKYCRRTGQSGFGWLRIGDSKMTQQELFINRLGIVLAAIGLVISWSIVGWTDLFTPDSWRSS